MVALYKYKYLYKWLLGKYFWGPEMIFTGGYNSDVNFSPSVSHGKPLSIVVVMPALIQI